MTSLRHDPVTFDIIQNSLQAISDEMFAAMRKTSMSAVIYEVLDMGTGICAANGEIASSGAGIPAFIGVLDKAAKAVIRKHPIATIHPGDIFATNDPFYGGVTHLNDMVLVMPVFVEGEIVAWTANIAHWNDVGGMVPGSMSTDATTIFQEGIRVPAIKLVEKGVASQAVIDLLTVNSRLPAFLKGDLWAAIAAVRIGDKRILDLVKKYGKDTFVTAMNHFMDYGEQVTLKALKDLPKGVFPFAEEQDNGLIYKVSIEITDDAFIVDLADNPDQTLSPSNASRDGVTVAAQMAIKAVTDVAAPANGGSFRPLVLKTRPGSVFDAQEPAAHGFYYEVEIRVFDLILRCLAPHLGDRLSAGSFASICGTVIGGPHPDTGRHYTIVEPEIGGWGGMLGRDGNSAIFSGFHGETFNCPAEVAEARYGLFVEQLALNPEEGGEGEWRGGKGIRLDYRVRADGNFLTCGYTRSRILPWGMEGGRDGTPNYIDVIKTDGSQKRYAFATGVALNEGDIVRVVTGNGGGYGDPAKRDRAAILDDIKNGYLSPARARDVYGVEV
ncbi:hydantoinase B/oxoprolinase family protein [Kaistia dalseonensis]|uniref:N-methylhydantoinase B n=1 Tax=Kaistia dalseonensis TaxID=410840 RepID=A0ABU0H351_9HYPH|nr:hydantoinase B/oxoprolinase family protein [Kaistia dalseonensis]MCX5494133.1 hydantoinase B/oxoprolinase family protein [Kaistia dalseonensis]MDQ0436712.1 N-methylhydantoinase B [Kaistia dalseonensis]